MKSLSKSRLAKLSEFVRKQCLCPCCGEEKECLDDYCTYDVDDRGHGYERMMEAREIYWGKEKS